MSIKNLFLCVLTVGSMTTGRCAASTVFQNVFGRVTVLGTAADDFVELSEDQGTGEFFVTVSDSTGLGPIVHAFKDVNGVTVLGDDGDDVVTISGTVTINGSVTMLLADGNDIFQTDGTGDLTINGDFDLDLGAAFNEVRYDSQVSALTVHGNIEILGNTGFINLLHISNWSIDKNFTFLGGKSTDSLFTANNGAFGLDVGGDILMDLGSGLSFANLRFSVCGGDLTIRGGDDDDEVFIASTTINGATSITTYKGKDIVFSSNSKFVVTITINTGRHDDTVLFTRTDASSATIYTKGGTDLVQFEDSTVYFTTFVDGGLGFDIANEMGSNFGQPPVVQNVEAGNL